MRHLILMRHAEAGYSAPGQADFDRPLTPRGHEEARAQAALLREHKLLPDIVLCSPTRRTRSTWAEMNTVLAADLPMDFSMHDPQDLYQATADQIVTFLRQIDSRVDVVLLLAHNPGIHEAAQMLAQPGTGQTAVPDAVKLQSGYAPATMSIYSCGGREWFDLSPDTLTLKRVLPPTRSVF